MSDLYDDVQAAAKVFGKDLVTSENQSGSTPGDIGAIERGTRDRPDGTRETYERIEFRDHND